MKFVAIAYALVLTPIFFDCYCFLTKKGRCPTLEEQKKSINGLARCVEIVKSINKVS